MKVALIVLLVLFVLSIPIPIKIKYPKKNKEEKEKKPKAKKEKPKKDKKFPWFAFAKAFLPKIPKPIRYLIRHTTVAKVDLEMIISGTDASDTAIKFGHTNALVYSILSLLETLITLEPKKILISPDFYSEKNETKFSAVIKIIPLVIIFSLIPLIISAFGAFLIAKRSKDERKQ